MADAALDWQGDLSLTASGDLAMVDGNDLVEQRIIRRLLTAIRGYTWHLDYGAGLPQRIGRVATAKNIQALVQANMKLEVTVATVPVPAVTVDPDETISAGCCC